MDFGDELKRIRESRGMTVNQLAMYSEVSSATISRVENKKRGIPRPKYIRKLADALKYPYDDLMRLAGHLDNNQEKTSSIEETEEQKDMNELINFIRSTKRHENIKVLLDVSKNMKN